MIENNKFKKLTAEEKSAYLKEKKIPFLKRQYDAAFKKQSETEEKDILIDHGFDGIMELDNQLPKWWLGLFYFGTAFCIVYICAYSFTDFAHPISEYDAEYKEQMAAVRAYNESQPPITIETAVFSEDNIAAGEEISKAIVYLVTQMVVKVELVLTLQITSGKTNQRKNYSKMYSMS